MFDDDRLGFAFFSFSHSYDVKAFVKNKWMQYSVFYVEKRNSNKNSRIDSRKRRMVGLHDLDTNFFFDASYSYSFCHPNHST